MRKIIKQIDKQFIADNRGCYSVEQLMELSFMKKDNVTIYDVLKSEIHLFDKLKFMFDTQLLDRNQLEVILKTVEAPDFSMQFILEGMGFVDKKFKENENTQHWRKFREHNIDKKIIQIIIDLN